MKAYQFKIELRQVDTPVFRRFIVPASIPFKRFHHVIQEVMGWKNIHLYEFVFKKEPVVFTNDYKGLEEYKFYKKKMKDFKHKPEYAQFILKMPLKSVNNINIDHYIEKHPKFKYVYDFHDNWKHIVTLEEVIEDYPYKYPTCLEIEGHCPPEFVGGSKGYNHFLDVWHNPSHKEYKALKGWGKSKGYGELIDCDALNIHFSKFFRLKR